MKKISKAPFIREIGRITDYMYRMGWDERNAGNVSYMLGEEETAEYIECERAIREIEIGLPVKALAGKYFLVTGTGKFFRNVKEDPETNLGIIRVSPDGTKAELLWGYKDGGSCTCELSAHLKTHEVRLQTDKAHRTVIHSHPEYILVMEATTQCDEKELTHKLWQSHTEAIAVFPDGVKVVPCMVNGTTDIGLITAEKLRDCRLAVWANHGIYGTGGSMDETLGLIETVEKSAKIYVLKADSPVNKVITDDVLRLLAERFGVTPAKGILSEENKKWI